MLNVPLPSPFAAKSCKRFVELNIQAQKVVIGED